MPRSLRQVAPGLPHHVIHRGNNRRQIASHAFDYWRLLHHIADAAKHWRCLVHAVALMSNHLHLLATPADAEALPLFVKSFAVRYATFRNRRRSGSGKLFEQRYRSYVLDTDGAVAAATTYIDLNPVRAAIVRRAEEHRWTTARLHLGAPPLGDWPMELWTPSQWYRGLGSTDAARAAAYRQWLDASPSQLPEYADELREIEKSSSLHYGLRLRRPDGTRAAEAVVGYAPGRCAWSSCARSDGISRFWDSGA